MSIIDIFKERPDMDWIENQIRMCGRPSADLSIQMKDYIYKLEKFIKDNVNKE